MHCICIKNTLKKMFWLKYTKFELILDSLAKKIQDVIALMACSAKIEI